MKSAIIALVLAAAAGLHVRGADAQVGPGSAISAAELAIEGRPPIDRRFAHFGFSGALRVVISAGSRVLDPAVLAATDLEWTGRHRWTLLEGRREGPSVLGAPAGGAASEPLRGGEIRTPDSAGLWLLESASGGATPVIVELAASPGEDGTLNGYDIGHYPTAGSSRSDIYTAPEAFIEVTPNLQDLRLSEHLRMRNFLTKNQFDVWPKYVLIDLQLIDKLELIIQELRSMGVRADQLDVMSGFRTPRYNGPGGDGRASLSRHMWGDAADVWIDNDGDDRMDDLNGDCLVDIRDAHVMMRAVERVQRKYPTLTGGAGTYPATPEHGPFIHVDTRGEPARW